MSLPHEDFLYLGDTARFPYGDRSADELLVFARELAGILLDRGAKLLVIACNSATSAALPALEEELRERVPLVAVVRPESRLAAKATKTDKVGLIATPATVNSGAYAKALAEEAPQAELHAVASAELAPLIQEGGEVDHRTLACVEGACRPLKQAQVDTVILGCTHYPLVRPVLQRELGRGVTIVSSGEAIARGSSRSCARRTSRTTSAGAATTASSRPATPRSSAASARASCSCRSGRSSTCRSRRPGQRVGGRHEHRRRAARRPRTR